MTARPQKRNSTREMPRDQAAQGAPPQGVGGRQSHRPPLAVGGRYLPTCTQSEPRGFSPPRDPRLDDLRDIGLADHWLDVAEAIGFDAFLVAWSILDRSGPPGAARDNHRVRVPMVDRLYRHQRNRYIRELSDDGLTNTQIADRLRTEAGVTLSADGVSYVLRSGGAAG